MEAEALLHVLEVKVPLAKSIIEDHEQLQTLKDQQIQTLNEALVVSSSISADYQKIAQGWKEAAQAQAQADFWRDLLDSKFLWLGIGALAGAGAYAIIDRITGG